VAPQSTTPLTLRHRRRQRADLKDILRRRLALRRKRTIDTILADKELGRKAKQLHK